MNAKAIGIGEFGCVVINATEEVNNISIMLVTMIRFFMICFVTFITGFYEHFPCLNGLVFTSSANKKRNFKCFLIIFSFQWLEKIKKWRKNIRKSGTAIQPI